MAASCPICRRAVAPRTKNASHPFCSAACKLVDLGRWLDGGYRIPGPPVDLDAEHAGSRDGEHESLRAGSTPGAREDGEE